MLLTPILFSLNRIYLLFKAFGRKKKIEFARILYFLCPLKVVLEVLHDRALGSLGWRLLMTSTQEPNTIAPQSALCICSRKWKAKLIVPIYYGTKMSEYCFFYYFLFITGVSFDSKDSEIKFNRARWTTLKSLPEALRALCNISLEDGEELFADELLVY